MQIRKIIWNARQRLAGNYSVKNSDFIPIIKKHIPKDAISVIDVGCGKLNDDNPDKEDILISCFSDPKYEITGIDGFKENIEWRNNHRLRGEFILMDVRDIKKLGRKFDVVICHHVIEHLVKEESLALVKGLESITGKVLIIGTPVGFTDTHYAVDLHHNDLELHKCGWMPSEFEQMGYKTMTKKQAFLAIKKF